MLPSNEHRQAGQRQPHPSSRVRAQWAVYYFLNLGIPSRHCDLVVHWYQDVRGLQLPFKMQSGISGKVSCFWIFDIDC